MGTKININLLAGGTVVPFSFKRIYSFQYKNSV